MGLAAALFDMLRRLIARTLRVALVGCGKIADQHVLAIHRIPDCRIVALCDRELLMAKQLGERCGVSECFSDLSEMLRATTPIVVHITTPPQSHFSLAKQCLEFGSHVYLEKPFTVTAAEAESLIQLADRRDLKITAGHNLQFTLEMLKMRRLVQQGYRLPPVPGEPRVLWIRPARRQVRHERDPYQASIAAVRRVH